jgi:DNA-binding NtrC family response regulator
VLIRVIVGIDDDPLRERVVAILSGPELHIVAAGDRAAADVKARASSYDLLFVDGRADDPQVHELLAVLARLPDRPQLVSLLRDDVESARGVLLEAGAMAVLDSQLDDALLRPAISGLVSQRREERLAQLEARRRSTGTTVVITESQPMREVIDTAQRAAGASSPVLILGETGVGKERIAELIHQASPRSKRPFVTVNCAAIPSELFESELFGHEKGAFTGASRARRGLFELAHEGTLFLDEIGEVPLHLQVKLLRALQEHRIRPLGADTPVEIDVRVIAATNRDLAVEMAAGTFRRDLYYRLGVVELSIPPLRERPADIDVLATAYAERFRLQLGREVDGFEPPAAEALRRYTWPGNVRELVNVVERAVLLSEAEKIRLSDLPASVSACVSLSEPALSDEPPSTSQLDEVVRLPIKWREVPWRVVREGVLLAGERAYLTALLEATRGRVGDAAKRAGMSPRALFEKMRRHGLRKEDFRNGPP